MALVSVSRHRDSTLGPNSYNSTHKSITETVIVSQIIIWFVSIELPFEENSIEILLKQTFFYSWGRGQPEDYTEAINLGGDDSRYDPMDDKKPRAGQILWIRGLTRLQTQVSGPHPF